MAIALGRVIVSYEDRGILARVFLGAYWTTRVLEEADKLEQKAEAKVYFHEEGQWVTLPDLDKS